METLKSFTEELRAALEVYQEQAEDNGQIGDIHTFESMITEHDIVSKYCDMLEEKYIPHQRINNTQLYMMLRGEDIDISKGLHNIFESYYNHLEGKMMKLRDIKNSIKDYQGVIQKGIQDKDRG